MCCYLLSVINCRQLKLFTHNTGLVVSICLGGAFVGSLLSGWIADGFGRRRAFQLCVLPMILGASIRY